MFDQRTSLSPSFSRSPSLPPSPVTTGRALGFVRALAATVGLGLFAVSASGAGCFPESAFLCTTDEECVGMGDGGVCEPNSFCSYPDLECMGTGRRWHDRATGSLAGDCVESGPLGATDTDTDGMMTMGSTGDPSTASTVTTEAPTTSSSVTTMDVDPTTSTSGPATSTSTTAAASSSSTSGSTGPAGTCDAMYGAADGYMLCTETMDTCSFNATLMMMMSCDDICTGLGGMCTGAQLNDVDLCAPNGAATCDDATANDLICECSNG